MDFQNLTNAPDDLSDLTPLFAASIQDGWTAWEELRIKTPELQIPLDPRTRAAFVHAHIRASARQRFSAMAGVHISEKRGFLCLEIHRNGRVYHVRFKKLDKSGRSSNAPTFQQLEWFAESPQLNLPGIDASAVRINAGYQVDVFGVEISAMLLTHQIEGKVIWKFPIDDPDSKVIQMQLKPVKGPPPPNITSSRLHVDESESEDIAGDETSDE